MEMLSKQGTISRRSGAGRSAIVRSHLAARRENTAPDRARRNGLEARKEGVEGVGLVIEKIERAGRTGKEVVRGRENTRIGGRGTIPEYLMLHEINVRFIVPSCMPATLVLTKMIQSTTGTPRENVIIRTTNPGGDGLSSVQ